MNIMKYLLHNVSALDGSRLFGR